MNFDLDTIRALIAAVDQTDVAELSLESGEFKIAIKKATQGAPVYVTAPAAAAPAPLGAPSASAPAPAAAAPARAALTINAPMVGTFYRASSPESAPFVEVGDAVAPGQTVCIIEAMKLMNELESEVGGRVVRFLVENGQPVEYGQPLIELEPQ